jgi:membrane protease YdiL (CAAX protease family)
MPARYWLFVALTLALTGFTGYGAYRTAQFLRSWRPDRNLLLLPAENLVRIVLIGICLALGRLSGLDAGALGWRLQPLLPQLGGGLLIGVGLALVFYTSTRWVAAHAGPRIYSPAVLEIIVPRSRREFWAVVAVMVPMVVLEELLFRSLLLGGLLPVLPAAGLLAATGVIFGLMHSPQGLWGMAGAGLAGVLLGLLFLWAGSLLLPMTAHYVANVVQVELAMRTGPPPAPGPASAKPPPLEL